MKTSIWTYPWDMAEVGPRQVAAEIAETGLESISLAATYHSFDAVRPRSTGNRLLTVDTSAAYYPCDPEAFADGPLVPSRSSLLTGEDWSDCARAARSAGLGIVAWTLFLHNSYLSGAHPELAQITCTGDRLGHHLCPMQPHVRSYACSLASDICGSGDVGILECESLSFGGYGHSHFHPKIGLDLGPGGRFLFSLCFCDACEREATATRIDIQAVRSRALAQIERVFKSGLPIEASPEELIDADPDLQSFARFRDNTVTTLIREVVHAAGKPVRILAMGDRHTSALDLNPVAELVDAVEILCYTSDRDRIRKMIERAAIDTGSPNRVGVGLQAYPPASPSPQTLRTSVQTVRKAGVDRISFYNYGIMPKQNLDWIRQSLNN